MLLRIIVALHILAALLPFAARQTEIPADAGDFPEWPAEFAGRPLTRLPLTAQERGFAADFPGRIARFSDGYREIIVRDVVRPSRQLHPSADCLRGSGFAVETQPLSRDGSGRLWGCALAVRDGRRFRVCEQIGDRSGASWYDASSWFWAGLLRDSQGPWRAVTVAEPLAAANLSAGAAR